MTKIIGKALPNMPWQEKPEGYTMPVWRYTENPIIITKDNDQYIANWGSFSIPVSKKVGNYYINNATLKSFNDEKLLREFLKKVP